MFQRAGMRERGLPLPTTFQYLILSLSFKFGYDIFTADCFTGFKINRPPIANIFGPSVFADFPNFYKLGNAFEKLSRKIEEHEKTNLTSYRLYKLVSAEKMFREIGMRKKN